MWFDQVRLNYLLYELRTKVISDIFPPGMCRPNVETHCSMCVSFLYLTFQQLNVYYAVATGHPLRMLVIKTPQRLQSSGILRHVALERTDVSEVLSSSIIRVTRINELGHQP
jgi:hypothetical protein